ncbi:Dolichyl-diphosphooligosaccharide--protein glycosyltransferase subunit 4 [Podospora australis]|uniref:Dolichyl-diphosphooligosaccharide--protein glycosyltransferase subunit 4 n=1 Tax=Podospora australis TaxID=1536484 RepID=A0AAN7AIM1_9PEZI|nr:Dolichyl-diphosphooligosaccharide--protein glycosyltransferase subunit 4 [Podospora australis]
MITDSQLYSLAILLGSAAMVLIVVYHFLEVNADDNKDAPLKEKVPVKATAQTTSATTKSR